VVSGSPSEVARVVLDLAAARPATLASGRLVCIDGPGGSGKSTLADAIVALEPSGRVVHMDDLFEGWEGLPAITAQLGSILRPLAEGRPGSYRRWDWHAGEWAETVPVEPAPLLVLEGVGSGSLGHAELITVLAWVEVPYDLRMARGLERGGVGVAENWRQWAIGEQELFATEQTRQRADVLVDGTGAESPRVARGPVE
jgi:energy-coupling factor transporter ATP-binding protein EcfA2